MLVIAIVGGSRTARLGDTGHHIVGLSGDVALELKEGLGAGRRSLVGSLIALKTARNTESALASLIKRK